MAVEGGLFNAGVGRPMVRVVSYLGPKGGSWVYQLEVTSRGQLTSLSAGLKKGLRAGHGR